MAYTQVDVRDDAGIAGIEEDAVHRPALGKVLLWFGALFALGIFWRVYQQIFAWSCSEATDPCYSRIWMPFLYVEMVVWTIWGSVWFAWLAKGCRTCDEHRATLGAVHPRHEASHLWSLLGMLFVFCLAVYWGGSYYAEEDGSWHQVAVRDTAFTPAHIIIFYAAFPVFAILIIATYLYARTRLPALFRDRGMNFGFALLLTAGVMEIFQVAFNEWSHSFWIAEEIFAAPFHWGFVLWGYMAAGIFGVWAVMFRRIFELEEQLDEAEAPALVPSVGVSG